MFDPCNCGPGEDILFGPNRLSTTSTTFIVENAPVRVLSMELPAGTEVHIFQIKKVCEENFYCDIACVPSCGSVAITTPGRYEARMVASQPLDANPVPPLANPEDIIVWVDEIPETMANNLWSHDMSNCPLSIDDIKTIVNGCLAAQAPSILSITPVAAPAAGWTVQLGNGTELAIPLNAVDGVEAEGNTIGLDIPAICAAMVGDPTCAAAIAGLATNDGIVTSGAIVGTNLVLNRSVGPSLTIDISSLVAGDLALPAMTAAFQAASVAQRRAFMAAIFSPEGSGWVDTQGRYGENDALQGTTGYTDISVL